VIAVAWALFAVTLGCAFAVRFARCLAEFEPRWAASLIVFGSGAAAGMGLTSCLFFLCRLAAPGMPRLALFIEIACFGWLAYSISRRRQTPTTAAAPPALFVPSLLGAVVLALLVATGAMATAWELNPQGNWDAWSIWNLRARFLAAGDLLQRAWSPALSATHPEYPLLVSGFVARCWTFAGQTTAAAPIATSYLFFLSLLATTTGGLAVHRGRSFGLLAGLILLGTPALLHEVIAQYADIPLACYMTGATMLALLDRPRLAGLLAGLAAWTKDEGLLFLLIFLTVMAISRRDQVLTACVGAIPGGVLAVVFKIMFAPTASVLLHPGSSPILQRLTDAGRFWQVLTAFAREFGALGSGWYHPILPVIALAVGLGFERERRKDLLFATAIPFATLAGYFCVFLVTPLDLKWQLDTSLYRLVIQIWPSLLIACFLALRRMESSVVHAPPAAVKTRKKKAKA